MLKTIESLQGVNILSKQSQKRLQGGVAAAGSGSCGFQTTNGTWIMANDSNGSGGTKDDALSGAGSTGPNYLWTSNGFVNQGSSNGHWCCASCPWN